MPYSTIPAPVTPEEKLYQLIISRLNGADLATEEYRERLEALVAKGIGGFIIFGGEREEVTELVRKLQSRARIPLFIASDVERGVEQQIRGATPFPCPMAMAAAVRRERQDEVILLEDALRAFAAEAHEVGITMPLIPVMDVNRNPDNPIICTRAFSDSPDVVSWFGARYIRALEASGLLSCAKHFPGHGDTATDSHIELPVIGKRYEELRDTDVAPFVEAIRAGAGSIMVGHLAIPALDTRPASLSRRIVTELLREQLGFEGLVLTDALNMSALRDFGDVPVECLTAGADILLHPHDADSTVPDLARAIEAGRLPEETVNKAVDRIIASKERYAAKSSYGSVVDSEKSKALSRELTERSITLVKGTPGCLPLSAGDRECLILGGDKFYDIAPLRAYFETVAPLSSDYPPRRERVIIALFTSVTAWKGTSGIEERERHYLSELIKGARKSIVISFGSPYVLRYFDEADILIAAYEGTRQAQSAVVTCLTGEAVFRGELPVALYPG
ncbi:MAG: glycoside hydrolase family 3 protein [Nitrospirota bacterium]